MKFYRFRVFFVNPKVSEVGIYAANQVQAEIKAMAIKIELGHDFEIDEVICEELKTREKAIVSY